MMKATTMLSVAALLMTLASVPAVAGVGCGAPGSPAQSAAEEGGPKPSCGSSAPQPPSGSARLLSETGVVEIPFEHVFDYIVIPVSVDGSEPLRLILDTGMPFYGAVLHPNPRTDAIELVNRDSVQVVVGGLEDVTPRVGSGVTLTIPGVELTDQIVTVLPAPGACQGGDLLQTDGVIGLTIFENFVVKIDQEREILTLTDPAKFSYAGLGQAIPIRLGPTPMPEVALEVEIEEGRRVPLSLVVDTGAMYAMSLTLGTDEGISLPPGARELVTGYSSWGEVSGKLGRVEALHIGEFVLDDVLVTFFQKGAPGVPPCGEHGILGNVTLRRFNVTFDYAGKTMYLEPNSSFVDPFEFGMGGFASGKADDGTLRVLKVFRDSPASENGLKEGDIILSINGVPANDRSESVLREVLSKEGDEVTLCVSRGGHEMDINLRLRRLI